MSLPTAPPMAVTAEAPADAGRGAGVRRRAVIAGGAGALAAVAGSLLVLPHLSGGSPSMATVAAAPRPATTSTAAPAASAVPSAVAVAGTRNPFAVPPQFRPRTASPTAAVPHATPIVTTPIGTPPATTVASPPSAPVTAAPVPVNTAPVGRPTAPPPPVWVRLTSVSSDNSAAVLRVGARRATSHPGAAFGGGFRLMRLEAGRCATVAYGSDHFDLCAGSAVLVPGRPPR